MKRRFNLISEKCGASSAFFRKYKAKLKFNWQWLAFGLAALAILFFPLPALPSAPAPQERVIRVEASMYQFSPAEIAVNPGDQVTLKLTSTDVVHGLSLDGYHFNLVAEAGQTASQTFTASQSGSFRFRCSEPCGNLHPFMTGKLQVGPDTLFGRAIGLGALAVIAALWSLRTSLNGRSQSGVDV